MRARPSDRRRAFRRNRRRSLLAGLAIAASCLAFGACDEFKRETPAPRDYKNDSARIAVIGRSTKDHEYLVVQRTCAKFLEIMPRVEIEIFAPTDRTPSAQRDLLQEVAERRWDVICIVPIESASLKTSVGDIVRSGRRIITIARDVEDSSRTAYFGPDERSVGRAAAQACPAALAGKPKTVMLLHAGVDHPDYSSRHLAFKHELGLVGGGIHLLKEVNGKANAVDARQVIRTESHKYPRLGAWVFLDDWPYQRLPPENRLVPLGCGVVLCDGRPEHFDRLRDGRVEALIGFDLWQTIDDALFAAVDLANSQRTGSSTVTTRYTPVEIITRSNLADYEHRWNLWKVGKPSPESSNVDAIEP